MTTPLYNELVNKYYLSRGVVPFSYPERPVVIDYIPLAHKGPRDPVAGVYFNLKG